MDEVEVQIAKTDAIAKKEIFYYAIPVIQKYLSCSRAIRFSGDNYSEDWANEAKKRGLPNFKKSFYSFKALKAPSTKKVFEGILNETELDSRYEVATDMYASAMDIEANLMIDMFRSQLLQAALLTQKEMSRSLLLTKEALGFIPEKQKIALNHLTLTIEAAIQAVDELEKLRQEAKGLKGDARGKAYCDHVSPACANARKWVDELEQISNDCYWPLPKYSELLFFV